MIYVADLAAGPAPAPTVWLALVSACGGGAARTYISIFFSPDRYPAASSSNSSRHPRPQK